MTETVRSVSRSMLLMATLNRHNGAGLNWLAKATGLSRGTTYRMLETFIAEGYATKDPNERGYWLTEKVQELSDGYADTGWIATIAKPRLRDLGQDVVWPLSLCVPSNTSMVVKLTTDKDTPLTMELISAGLRMPMLTSAAGRAYLAYCPDMERAALLDLIRRNGEADTTGLTTYPDALNRLIAAIRRQGFVVLEGSHRVSNLAVPLLYNGYAFGCIVIRFYTSTMGLEEAAKTFATPMQAAAADIAHTYADMQIQTQPESHTPGLGS